MSNLFIHNTINNNHITMWKGCMYKKVKA